MTEDEREELIQRLLDEFRESIGPAFNDDYKFGFVAGARAALVSHEQNVPSGGNSK